MKFWSGKLFVCAMVLVGMAGCANPPTTLGKVPARINVVEKYGNAPAYTAVDKFSFLQADVEYPASGGHHRINIGDFLLGEVFEAVQGKEITSLRLVSFKSQCNNGSVILPRAMCKTDWVMDVSANGVNKRIVSSLPVIDIGNVHVRQDQFMLIPIVKGDDFFQGQIGPLLKMISTDVVEKLVAGIPQ